MHDDTDQLIFQNDSKLTVMGPDNPQTTVHVSCSLITTDSNLNWVWEYEGNQLTSGDRYKVIISNDRRNTTLVISEARYTDSGNYTCQVSYRGGSKKYRRTKELIFQSKHCMLFHFFQVLKLFIHMVITDELRASTRIVPFTSESSTATLICEEYGYLVESIKWKRNGETVTPIPGKYETKVSAGTAINSVNSEGRWIRSIISHLIIINPEELDSGLYECYTLSGRLNISLSYAGIYM